MPLIPVTDPDDPRIVDYRSVPDPELLLGRGVFVAEGRLVVTRLLAESPLVPRSVLVTETTRHALGEVLAARPDLPVYVAPQAVVNSVAGFNIHRGCLAIGERPAPPAWSDLVTDRRRLVFLERVGNADNVGGIFRSAAVFGVDAVLLEASCADPLYRKAIRTSMGAALRIPFVRLDDWPATLKTVRERGVVLVALTPAAPLALAECVAALPAGRPIALVFGHEGEGLGQATLETCEFQARIPMAAGVDSLNVTTAAAIALYELERQAAPSSKPSAQSPGPVPKVQSPEPRAQKDPCP